MSPERYTESGKKPDLTIHYVNPNDPDRKTRPVIFVEAKRHGPHSDNFCKAMQQVANAATSTLGDLDIPSAYVLVIKGYDFAFFEYHVQTGDDLYEIPNYKGLVPLNASYRTIDTREPRYPRFDFHKYQAGQSIVYDLENTADVSSLHPTLFFFLINDSPSEIKSLKRPGIMHGIFIKDIPMCISFIVCTLTSGCFMIYCVVHC